MEVTSAFLSTSRFVDDLSSLSTRSARNSPAETACQSHPNLDRRSFLVQPVVVSSAAAALLTFSPASAIAGGGTETEDKTKILMGYQRLTYLLENWDKETTFCGTKLDPYSGKQICEKSPLIIQDYMGYRSINDPLFKADKTLRRLEALVPPDKETDFLDAVEKWQITADEASGMAYTSSWAGPQNPNGGDDAIDFYLDRAKKQVVDARNVLAQVIDILNLK
ncbi:hypothetical protein IV203_003274 [Nitzschia inconspicua]|uniref:Uncharacterized protein n=1 Tax=Nitzschia inconspicua TaxID=303405 RepID=A0A9K3L1K9_9STRA|nr:hypothetical protein IV203_003274 [Nitzschia inconspicua]